MKNLDDTIGNRTRDLPACSAVPQPTTPPRAPYPLLIRNGINSYVDCGYWLPYKLDKQRDLRWGKKDVTQFY